MVCCLLSKNCFGRSLPALQVRNPKYPLVGPQLQQESGVRSQESEVRSQKSGVRSQESGVKIASCLGFNLDSVPHLSAICGMLVHFLYLLYTLFPSTLMLTKNYIFEVKFCIVWIIDRIFFYLFNFFSKS